MTETIKILVKEPGKPWHEEVIENELDAFQEKVDGYIETFSLSSDAVIICNEEGRINNSMFNCNFLGYQWYGTILICGVKGEEFTSVPGKLIDLI